MYILMGCCCMSGHAVYALPADSARCDMRALMQCMCAAVWQRAVLGSAQPI